MQPLLTQLLNLPGMDVEDYQDRGYELILEVEARQASASCPRCNHISQHLHQNHGHRVRDLSIRERPVFLKLNRREYKCRLCGKPFSEAFEFVGQRREYTDRFAEMIVQQVRHSDLHNVGVNHRANASYSSSTLSKKSSSQPAHSRLFFMPTFRVVS